MASKILCCLCGVSIIPNEAAMCMDCLRSEVDITSDFNKDYEIVQCRKCDRFCVSRDHWAHHELESSSLLAVCLRKIQGLNHIKVLDAKWIWTEPHSMRLKINVTVQRAVLDEKLEIKQNLEVNYVIKNKQCLDCIREATEHTWGALVQVRQRRANKSTLCVLEGIILKSGLQHTMINIEVVREGLDFYFRSKNQADKVVDLISSTILPLAYGS